MTVMLGNLTVQAESYRQRGTRHHEVTAVVNEHGEHVQVTPEMLDAIEQVLEAEAQVDQWEEDYWNCEVPHLIHAYC